MAQDSADLHVERWRDHWLDIRFDDEVEAFTVRIIALSRYLRDTPGHASPGALAQELGVSNAGMTGRLDALEKRGWVARRTGAEDRRRVEVEVTDDGARVWHEAMDLRGTAEDDLAAALSRRELVTLNRLLKKLTLRVEGDRG